MAAPVHDFLKKVANCAQRLQKNTCDAFLDLVTICAHVLSSKKPPMTESPGVKARGQTKTRLPNTTFRENVRFLRDFFRENSRFFVIFCIFCENAPPQANDFAKVRFESASSGFPTPMISQNGESVAHFCVF